MWYSANPFNFNSLYLLSKWNWKVLILQRALELAQTKCQKRFSKWCVFISMCYSKCSAGEYIFGDWRRELIYFAVAFDYNFTTTNVWISANIFVLPTVLEYAPSEMVCLHKNIHLISGSRFSAKWKWSVILEPGF